MAVPSENRRRFFRIVDAIGVSYQIVTDKGQALQYIDKDNTYKVNTATLMEGVDKEINHALGLLRNTQPEAAMAVDAMNRKLDTLLMLLELDNLIVNPAIHQVEHASISASGIAFPVEERLASGTVLSLDLILKPSTKHVTALGKVIACDSLHEKNQYYLRVEFVEMEEKNRETLIQHIVQRQGVLLRALKNEVDDL